MLPEPKKPIEDLLQATAKARRAQFGGHSKMPNPMRTQLHAELARVARSDDSRRTGNWFRVLWPRLAFATAFALILVSISTLWWWHQHQTGPGETMKLAMQKPARGAAPPDKVFEQGAVAAARPEAPALSDTNALAAPPAEAAKDADALARFGEAATSATVAPPSGGVAASGNNKSLATKESNPPEPATAPFALSRQNFRQKPSSNATQQVFRSKQTPNILNEFQVEQSDHEIRLVDADGSTYSGKLEPLSRRDARSIYNQKSNDNATASGPDANLDQKAQSTNTEYYFRATGYNSSLKKSLVFEGNYVAPLTVAQKKVAKAKTELEERDQEMSARIIGVAKVQGESPTQIDAVAVP